MTGLVLTTFDRVPEMPQGYVRDLRVRWALEEACLPYRVRSVPFGAGGAEHFAHQPFGQVPWLTDGDPACRAYVARATARPAFVKAHADQLAHFAAADAVKASSC